MRRFLFSMLLTAGVVALAGCMAYDEGKDGMDFVIGSGYTPPVDRLAAYVPKRILLLPLTGHLDDRYKHEFLNTFRSVLNDQAPWTVIDWPGSTLGDSRLEVLRADALEMANRLQCDTMLFIQLEDASIYPPLRQCVRYTLEQTATGQVIASAFQDFDSSTKPVANSARSFYQTNLNRQISPDKSLIILNSNPLFTKYVATESANSLKMALQPPPTSTASTETVSPLPRR